MKSVLKYGGVFIAFYLLFLLSKIPASIITNNVSLPEDISLHHVTGTIWQININQVRYQHFIIDNVSVAISPWSLFTFNPRLAIAFGDETLPGPAGSLILSGLLGDLAANDVAVELEANIIAQQLSLPFPVTAHNYVDVSIDEYLMGQPLCQKMQGDVRWKQAKITSFEQPFTLGDLSAKLACDQGQLTVDIDPNNDLGLALAAIVGEGYNVAVDGFIAPGDRFPPELKSMLSFLGRPDSQGRYPLKF